ncbi:MAG: carboxypeptidase-like regulatory domain-containing protein [Terracidiphilus sp.]|nr:carboxypeptidase-like regulatory domain-containing protein [Terracidiphilus sp.]
MAAAFGRVVRAGLLLLLFSAAGFSICAQDLAQPASVDRTLTSLHGVVRNAATGQGLARALVRIEGDAEAGALTDGEGRFGIPNIPAGPQSVTVEKPGFLDRSFSAGNGTGQFVVFAAAGGHNVLVAAQMPDVVFTLAPTGAIRGQVELSTGDAAEGIKIVLAQRAIQDGRSLWQQAASAKTRSDGTFRFGGLADGDYALFTEPAMDSDLDGAPGGDGQRWGYAAVYYPDAREPSGVAKIHVANGQEAQANLLLTLEPFQPVSAVAVMPQGNAAARAGRNLSAMVMDSGGHQLPYPAQYDEETHMVQALLPDGTYTLLVSTIPNPVENPASVHISSGSSREQEALAGSVEFTVAGRAVTRLRVPLSMPRPNPVQVNLIHGGAQSAETGVGQNDQITVMVSQAGGWVDDGMVSAYASGPVAGPLAASNTALGAYWVHTHIAAKGLCEGSFTAGGASMGREPVRIGLSGSTAPMELAVRDDCASLELSLPEALASITAGEEPFFTVYVVPDFDSTADVQPVTLRASTGGTVTLSSLTPGTYRVYTFLGPVELAYRNREAMAAMPYRGLALTLSAGAAANLTLEVAGQ